MTKFGWMEPLKMENCGMESLYIYDEDGIIQRLKYLEESIIQMDNCNLYYCSITFINQNF